MSSMMRYCNLREVSPVTEKRIRLHSVPAWAFKKCGRGSRVWGSAKGVKPEELSGEDARRQKAR
jgi:hypothetical protein